MEPSTGQEEGGLWSLPYYENLRKTATQVTRTAGSNIDLVTLTDDPDTLAEPEVLPICHLNYMMGWTWPNYPTTASLMAMAAHHLNTGNGMFVPSLEGLPDRCPIRFTIEATDTKFDRGTALDRMKETIRHRSVQDFDYTASPPAPCAIVGEYYSSVTVVTAPVSGLFDIPLVSASATSVDLDNKSIYKLFGRTIPSDNGIAVTIVQFLSNTLGAKYFNVVYQDDAFQNALITSLRDSIKNHAPDMLMNAVLYSPDSPTGPQDATKALKSSRYRYTLSLVWPSAYALFEEAHAQGIGGDGLHQWFFIGDTIPIIDTYRAGSALYDFFQGIGVVEITSGEAGMPVFDKWINELSTLAENSQEYLSDFFSTFYSAEEVEDAFAPDSSLWQGDSGVYGPFWYDAIVGLGLAACNAWDANTKSLQGTDHYAAFQNLTFSGVTGNVVLNEAGSREPTSALYRLRNYRRKQVQGNQTFYGFEPTTSYSFQDGEWIPLDSYVFNDGTTDIPIDIGPLPTNEENFFDNTYAVVGVAAALVIIVVMIFFIIREMKRKANDLLWRIKKEELEFAQPPKVLGRGTFGEVVLAEYRGTKVAVKQILTHGGSVNGSSTTPSGKLGTVPTRYGTHSVGLVSLRYQRSSTGSSNSSDEENGLQSRRMTSNRRNTSKGRSGKSMDKRIREDFIEEMRQLSRLRCPNIATVVGAVLDNKYPMLVMELMPMGSLYDVIHNPTIQLDGDTIIDILCDVTQGMRFLHKSDPPVIHGDLKTQNVLIDNHFRAKVADFGLAQNDALGGTGTPYWMAPELLRKESGNNTATDIFSFGVLMFEVCTRQLPYEGEDSNTVIAGIKDRIIKKRVSFPINLNEKVRALMTDCMDEKPESRASFDEIDGRLRRLEPDTVVPTTVASMAKKPERSLHDIFPPPIAKVLQSGGRVEQEYKENVAILACSIAGMDDILCEMSPFKKARMIERLQNNLRDIAKKHGVFMVTSDADTFVAVTNLVKQSKSKDHILRMVDFAFDASLSNQTLIDDTNPTSEAYVTLKVGLHVGSLTTAVIGNRNPRLALLGDDVHTACAMAKHSKSCMILASPEAAEAIETLKAFEVKLRDDTRVILRCRGDVDCFWVSRKNRLAMDSLERVRANQRRRHLQLSMKSTTAPAANPSPPISAVPVVTANINKRPVKTSPRISITKSIVDQVKEEAEDDISESQNDDMTELQGRLQTRLSGNSFDVEEHIHIP